MNLETLIVTMNKIEPSFVEEMSARGDIIVANQCSINCVDDFNINNKNIRMVSTTTKGVGLNRNIAIANSTADILLFADDDVKYKEDYVEKVIQAYEDYPEADMIIFGMTIIRNGKIERVVKNNNKRIGFWQGRKYGGVVISVRRTSLLAHNVGFNQLFGGGCIYSCGEDTLFVFDCIRSGMHTYTNEYVLGETIKDESTWFKGFDDKYFYDKGAWVNAAFGRNNFLIRLYYAIRMRKKTKLTFSSRMRLMKAGSDNYFQQCTYENWKSGVV